MAGRRSPIKTLPSKEELLRLLSYSPETGELTWNQICKRGFRRAGKSAGTVTERGYLAVGICGVQYLSQRLIWKMMTGKDPGDFVDHEDRDRLNNRWINLRPASNGQNIQNSKIRKDNRSGVKGVHWDSEAKKWRAVVTANGIDHKVGRFTDLSAAAAAVQNKRAKLHGDFARFA